MNILRFACVGLAGLFAATTAAWGQRPYIGFVYPAGGQQGTTFQVRLGGQGLDGVEQVLVSGSGVEAKAVDYYRRLGPVELNLLREQMNELKRGSKGAASATTRKPGAASAPSEGAMMAAGAADGASAAGPDEATQKLITKIEKRIAEYCNRPACNSLSSLAFVEVTIAPDADAGQREITLVTSRGVSNPLVFCVGQFPEATRKPMVTANYQVLGKEELALRKRPDDEIEDRVGVPSTLNGQIASGEVNRYRFEARQGQRLVITTVARQLVPYIADAVPGWFQPVMWLSDANGKELAFDDDYRFKPDPTIMYKIPRDGEYVLSITDAIYRGREDFVYRVTLAETPFVTSIFPLGGRAGTAPKVEMKGWNLQSARLALPGADAEPGVYLLAAGTKKGLVSNRVPFAVDTLPESFEQEPNNDRAHAQKVKLPIIVNGRINRPDDWDVFQFAGRAGETIVAEVDARRLDSPLDSVLKLTDASGKILAFNDDHEDPEAGVNTHDADSYLMAKLPADGTYCVHLGDTARHGGEEYAYRLRISAPRPDFSLEAVPTSVSLRSKGKAGLRVVAVRKDGFAGPIKLILKDPPKGIISSPGAVPAGKNEGWIGMKTDLADTKQPLSLAIEGRAKIGAREVAHMAVPVEDRMQAFLWRHLVPAEDLKLLVFDPSYQPPPKRVAPARPASAEAKPPAATTDGAAPAWDRITATCSASYCHGQFPGGNALNAVSWTTVDGTQAACGTCHGLPAPYPHPQNTGCATCHGAGYSASGNTAPTTGRSAPSSISRAISTSCVRLGSTMK